MLKGGGSWDEYCYCCGLPFSYDFDPEEHTNTKSTKKFLVEKNKEVEKCVAWIHTSIGLDSFHNAIFDLGRGSDMGEMRMKSKHAYPGAQELYDASSTIFTTGEGVGMNDESLHGLAIHKDCARVLETAIGRPLKPSDEVLLRRFQKSEESRNGGACFSKYNQQMYSWTEALIEEPVSFFASPLKDDTQRDRILTCNSKLIAAAKMKGGRTLKRKGKGTRRVRK